MVDYIKKNQRIINILVAVITPLIGIGILLLVKGMTLQEISIPCGDYNDELTYYKQVEAMIRYGHPQGYFGYNESHAIIGNFDAWSITTFLHFSIAGKLFGWNYITPIIVNLVLWILTFVVTTVLLKPSISQQVFISIAWISCSTNIRYIFSCAPESLVTIILLLFGVFFIRYNQNHNEIRWLVLADICLVYLTLMRGYYALFVLLILASMLKETKRIDLKVVVQVIVALLSMIAFVLLVHYTFSPYFTPDINLSWLVGPKSLIKSLLVGFIETMQYILDAILMKSIRGSWYLLYFLILPYIVYKCIKNRDWIYYSLLLSWCILISAMWTMYRIEESCRHIMICALVFAMIIVYIENKASVTLIVAIALVYATWFSHDTVMYNTLPRIDEEQLEAISEGSEKLNAAMQLTDNEWDNTIIWTRSTVYNELYALPEGFGINCCLDEFVLNNFDSLKSKYVTAYYDGEMNDFLSERGKLVATFGTTNVYEIR